MRFSTIVAGLLLAIPSPALACWEPVVAGPLWVEQGARYQVRAAEEAIAERVRGAEAWFAGAGVAALALVVVSFRAFSRASGGVRIAPSEFDPATPEELPAPSGRPGAAWCRIDPGHERPEPVGVGREGADLVATPGAAAIVG